MAFNGNAFALLGVDDVENLLAHVFTVNSEVPPSAVDKRNDNHKKAALASYHSSSAPANEKLSSNNRKGQNNINRVNHERINDTRHNRNGGNANNMSRKPAAFNGSKQATNGDCSGHEEVIEEGWQTVRRSRSRSKDYKQSNANHRRPSTDVNAAWKEEEVVKVLEENGDVGEKLNAGVQVADEARLEGDGTFLEEDKVLVNKEEIERLELEAKKLAELEAERELEAKKMTLKQYEKLLEEKRKFLESMKSEERRVALDTDFNSMRVVAKKNEEEEESKLNPASDHHKKKALNNKNNKIVLSRFPRRNGASSARLEGSRSHPKAASVLLPSFEDVQQFPALALNGTTKGN